MMIPKFRVWSKTLGKYRQLDETSNDQGLGMLFEVKKGIGSNVTSICYSIGDVAEQYTGLKDANGKEIYEGDIVHVVTEDGYERTGKVIFEKGCYWVDNGMDKYPVNRIGFERDTLEVLGNVHVNPNIIDFYDMKQL